MEDMQINTVHLVYYSATGNTETVARTVGETLAKQLSAGLEVHDYTLPAAREAAR